MAYKMTKAGSLDNEITYEFMCDAVEDMNAIENEYRTLGSIAIVLAGESGGLEIYITNSAREWIPLNTSNDEIDLSGYATKEELTAALSNLASIQTEIVQELPQSDISESTIYFVPKQGANGDSYDEYMYIGNAWEKVGNTQVDLSGYATLSDIPDTSIYAPKEGPEFTMNISMGRAENGAIGANSTAIGLNLNASGNYSHAEGFGSAQATQTIGNTTYTGSGAHGYYAHAEGNSTWAIGESSHAEGASTIASGAQAHAEGGASSATGDQSHTEGVSTIASGAQSHAEGNGPRAVGQASHAEGYSYSTTRTINGTVYNVEAHSTADHVEGYDTLTYGGQPGSHAEGFQTSAIGSASHSEGASTVASGVQSHAEGYNSIASGNQSHAEGNNSIASGTQSHAEGNGNIASGNGGSHAEGATTKAVGDCSHSEGMGNTSATKTINNATYTGSGAYGGNSHVEGYATWAIGSGAHAEGSSTVASGTYTHAEGNATTASGSIAHAEGASTIASGSQAHAEGINTIASGVNSHAEGVYTIAAGAASHAGGQCNIADSYDSWPEWVASTSYAVGNKVKRTTTSNGITTVQGYICKTANSDSSFTSSKWINQYGQMNYAEIIGNGTDSNARSNARALDWDGNEHLMGDIYVGCNANSTGGTKLPRIPEAPSTDGTYILQATVTSGIPTYSWVSLSSLSGVTF